MEEKRGWGRMRGRTDEGEKKRVMSRMVERQSVVGVEEEKEGRQGLGREQEIEHSGSEGGEGGEGMCLILRSV